MAMCILMNNKSLIFTLIGMELAKFLDDDNKQSISVNKKSDYEIYCGNEKDCPYCNGEKNG